MGMTASELRQAYTSFFVARGHTLVPSSGLIPHHPTAPLFTNAGMNQFVPYFLGEESPPYPRATSVQKCVRLSGKQSDIENLGKTRWHLTFFEMLGNFSFGDYFKADAIPMAWELLTEVVGFDPETLWITVHETDDEAESIWRDVVRFPAERIQRLGDDNFWEMGKGEPGPCGVSTEIHVDTGAEWGEGGGPAAGNERRYVEIWNNVFMQYERKPDLSLVDLPAKNVDTGGGMERWLVPLNNVPTVFDTDVLRPIVAEAESITGRAYGTDDSIDVSLRILADQARSMTFVAADGVAPSNEDRGYVLRSVVRRAVRHAYRLGVETQVTPRLIGAVVATMGEAYPDLVKKKDAIVSVLEHEEGSFLRTVRTGLTLLDIELGKSPDVLPGDVVFKLHDTYGFPKELTAEIAEERGVDIDAGGFEVAMAAQRERSKAGRAAAAVGGQATSYREILDRHGATDFVGYGESEAEANVLAVLPVPASGTETETSPRLEVFLDRTPFYAEGGGQVGDTGIIRTASGLLRVLDTTSALTGLHRHLVEVVEGEVAPGDSAVASVDTDRRDATRRNHTGTHLLHAALREVLGGHVHQQGSYVGPDRLRFDLNHHTPISPDELQRVEDLVNTEVLGNTPVRAYETTMEHAREIGALMFFGDKYGDIVRVVEAGQRSVELCGGTHVHALGTVGPVKVVAEGSIGSNLRRVEALTGASSLRQIRDDERLLEQTADLLRTKPDDVVDAVERLLKRQKELEDDLKTVRSQLARGEATQLVAGAEQGFVIGRRDGLSNDQLRDLAVAVRDAPGVKAAVFAGTPDGQRVAIAGAKAKDADVAVGELVGLVAKVCGGGGGGKGDVAVAGGRDPAKIDDALAQLRSTLGL